MHNPKDVELLQRLIGFLTTDEIEVDGHFGRETRAGLKEYGFEGTPDESLIRKMIGEAVVKAEAKDFPLWLAQAALNLWGQHPPLVVDNEPGPLTTSAIAGFQDTNSLETSGTLTQETVEAMQDKIRRGV